MRRIITPHGHILAEAKVGPLPGIPVNPKLPAGFDSTPNQDRPDSHRKFYGWPYIVTETAERLESRLNDAADKYAQVRRDYWEHEGRAKWFKDWPSGTRYEVRCLDGGAWDRSTCWGSFASLEAAVECAISGPTWRKTA